MGTYRAAASAQQPPKPGTQTRFYVAALLAAALAVVMLFHLLTLTRYPRVFIDESWLANSSWTWLNTGANYETLHHEVFGQFGYEWIVRFFLGELPYVAAYSVFGLGLFQTRLVAWLFGGALLALTVLLGRRLYSLNTGLLAALLLALSLPFLQASRFRQDIVLTTMVMAALWLALWAFRHERAWWAHLLAGLLVGVGMDVHQSAFMFAPALAALYLAHYGRKLLVRRGTWLAAAGGAAGVAIWAAIHILPSPETYSKLMSFYFAAGADAEMPITNPAALLDSAVREFGRYGFRQNVADLALIAAGGGLLLWRRSQADRLLLAFTGAAFLSFILFNGNKTSLYAIHLYPLFMLIVAQLFVTLLRRFEGARALRAGAALLAVAFIAYSGLRVASSALRAGDYDYYAITNRMREVIPPDARVMAMPLWWLGLADYDFSSSLNLAYYRFFNGYDAAEALAAIRPDYVVLDEVQSVVLADDDEELPQGLNAYRVSRAAFMQVLAERGTRVLTFTDPYHGSFEIYALDWQ